MQREPMNGLNTLCLLRGRLLVAAGEETTHDDVVGQGAYATPEREVGLFVGASVVPNLDPVSNVDEDAWLELPNNDSGARSVVVVRRSWAEVVPALGNNFVVVASVDQTGGSGSKRITIWPPGRQVGSGTRLTVIVDKLPEGYVLLFNLSVSHEK